MKKCNKCGLKKPLNEFHKYSRNRDGLSHQCKTCVRAYQAKWRQKNPELVKTYYARYVNKTYYNTLEGRATYLLKRAKIRAKEKGWEFDLTRDWVLQRLKKGVCEVTGLPFDLSKQDESLRHNPFAPSLDRIDPSRGYTKDNVQVVIWAYNAAKNEFGEYVLRAIAEALVSRDE